ncbi:hypothetical protein V6Z12_A06G136900 [Gossypium hirsutum]
MKLLSWNILGLERFQIVRRLQHLLTNINPFVVFLIETKLQGSTMVEVRCKCGFLNGINVDSNGRSGGLSLGWRNDCKVSRSFSMRQINMMVDEDIYGKTWRCTRFYRAPEESQRKASWNLMHSVDDCSHIPWLVIEDFSEIVYLSEKKGGLPQR